MRQSIILFFGLLNISLAASPVMEPKPADPFFTKLQPLKAPAYSRLILKKGDHLAICGDSITEQRKYSRIIEDYLTMCVPQLDVSVRQYGWSGEKAPQFLTRITNDCLRFDPTIATTCYGMNDFQYRPYNDNIGQSYYTNSLNIITVFKKHNVRVILGSPGCISRMPPWITNTAFTTEDLNLSLCDLRNIDLKLAGGENIRFADVFWPMYMAGYIGKKEYGPKYAIPGGDGVHPYWAGHLVMAYSFLKAMGLDGDIGTFTIDLKNKQIKVSEGHRVLSAKNDVFTIQSSRYPFCACAPENEITYTNPSYPICGKDALASNDSIRSGMTLVPFNQELNRLMLVVKHATGKKYLVTWGDQSKVFTSLQVASGINLAAEFPENPFSVGFAKVDAAIAAKQAFETKEIKDIFHQSKYPELKPAMAVRTDKLVGEIEKEHDSFVAAAHSAFMPVKYVISVVPQ